MTNLTLQKTEYFAHEARAYLVDRALEYCQVLDEGGEYDDLMYEIRLLDFVEILEAGQNPYKTEEDLLEAIDSYRIKTAKSKAVVIPSAYDEDEPEMVNNFYTQLPSNGDQNSYLGWDIEGNPIAKPFPQFNSSKRLFDGAASLFFDGYKWKWTTDGLQSFDLWYRPDAEGIINDEIIIDSKTWSSLMINTGFQGKQDKREGYGLSKNDLTDELKALVEVIKKDPLAPKNILCKDGVYRTLEELGIRTDFSDNTASSTLFYNLLAERDRDDTPKNEGVYAFVRDATGEPQLPAGKTTKWASYIWDTKAGTAQTGGWRLILLGYAVKPVEHQEIPFDFFASTSVEGGLITYKTDAYRTFDLQPLTGITITNTNEIIRNGNDIFISGNFSPDLSKTTFLIVLYGCYIEENVLKVTSYSSTEITGLSSAHSVTFHRGNVYLASRTYIDSSTFYPVKVARINPYDLADRHIYTLPNTTEYQGGTSDIIGYKDRLFILINKAYYGATYLVSLDTALASHKLIGNLAAATPGTAINFGIFSPFTIYNDKLYAPTIATATTQKIYEYSLGGKVLRTATYTIPNTNTNTTVPHWIGIYNGKIIITTSFDKILIRLNLATLTIEETRALDIQVTDDNTITRDGYLLLNGESSDGSIPSKLVKVRYNNFTDFTIEIDNYNAGKGSYGSLGHYHQVEESLEDPLVGERIKLESESADFTPTDPTWFGLASGVTKTSLKAGLSYIQANFVQKIKDAFVAVFTTTVFKVNASTELHLVSPELYFGRTNGFLLLGENFTGGDSFELYIADELAAGRFWLNATKDGFILGDYNTVKKGMQYEFTDNSGLADTSLVPAKWVKDYIAAGGTSSGGSSILEGADVTVDAGTNNSPALVLRSKYDSDGTVAILSTKRDISIFNKVASNGAYSLEMLNDAGTALLSVKDNGNLEASGYLVTVKGLKTAWGVEVTGTDNATSVAAGGMHRFLSGSNELFRLSPAEAILRSLLRFIQAASTGSAIVTAVTGEAANRFTLEVGGKMLWGDGAVAQDTNLYRSGAGALKTDQSLVVGNTLFVGAGITNSSKANSVIEFFTTGTKISTAVGANVALSIQNAAASPTGDLTQWLNSAGGVIAKMNNVGGLTFEWAALSDIRMNAVAGAGIRFWAGSSLYSIYMSQSGDTTWGGKMDSNSDFNQYFRMSGGTNRGFVFLNDRTPVAQIDGSGNLYLKGNVTGTTVKDASNVSPSFMVGLYDVPATEKTKLQTAANWDASGNYIGSPLLNTMQGQEHNTATHFYKAIADNTWIRMVRG